MNNLHELIKHIERYVNALDINPNYSTHKNFSNNSETYTIIYDKPSSLGCIFICYNSEQCYTVTQVIHPLKKEHLHRYTQEIALFKHYYQTSVNHIIPDYIMIMEDTLYIVKNNVIRMCIGFIDGDTSSNKTVFIDYKDI